MDGKLELADWERKEIFSFFSGISNPFYVVTFRQDVTALHSFVKKNGLSFYYSLIWLATKAMNNVEAFHTVIRNGETVKLENVKFEKHEIAKDTESIYLKHFLHFFVCCFD